MTKEPTGLFRTDGKRPHGLTLIPRQSSKPLCWNVTVICPQAESYVTGSAHEAGNAAELAASRKEEKCASIGSDGVALVPWQSGKSLCREITVAPAKFQNFQTFSFSKAIHGC